MPPKWGFSPICDPLRLFFKTLALSLLYPYGASNSCKNIKCKSKRLNGHILNAKDKYRKLLEKMVHSFHVPNILKSNLYPQPLSLPIKFILELNFALSLKNKISLECFDIFKSF